MASHDRDDRDECVEDRRLRAVDVVAVVVVAVCGAANGARDRPIRRRNCDAKMVFNVCKWMNLTNHDQAWTPMQYNTHEHSKYTHHDGRGAYIDILDI
jgi:hypothetical protein